MNKSTLSMLLALAPLVIQPACAPDDGAEAEADVVEAAKTGTAKSALLGGSKILWPMQDGKATVRVCWLPLDLAGVPMAGGPYAVDATKVLAERKQWVREGVEREWNAKTVVKFVGWQDCGAGEADIEIQPIGSNTDAQCGPGNVLSGGNCVEAIGVPDKGKRVFINVVFGDESIGQARYLQTVTTRTVSSDTAGRVYRPAICGTQMDAAASHFVNNQPVTAADIAAMTTVYKDCLQNVSNHEFGHLAGFSHEQDRADTTAACRAQYQAAVHDDPSEIDSPLGAFETDSIMSYCRVTLPATLTAQDVQQTNAFYEKFAPRLASAKPKDDSVAPPAGGATEPATDTGDTDPAPAAVPKKKKAALAVEKGGCNGS